VIRPKMRHPLPSLVPKLAYFLPAVLTDGAILSRSSVYCDRPQTPWAIQLSRLPRPWRFLRASGNAAWTYTARLVTVGPLECPGLQASGRAIMERLERAACRTEMADRRLKAQPPAYVQRELADTCFLACARG
jgi:hypothetical protein